LYFVAFSSQTSLSNSSYSPQGEHGSDSHVYPGQRLMALPKIKIYMFCYRAMLLSTHIWKIEVMLGNISDGSFLELK
jgi:hypothetical protein